MATFLANNLRDQTLAKWNLKKTKKNTKNRPILEQMAKVMRKITKSKDGAVSLRRTRSHTCSVPEPECSTFCDLKRSEFVPYCLFTSLIYVLEFTTVTLVIYNFMLLSCCPTWVTICIVLVRYAFAPTQGYVLSYYLQLHAIDTLFNPFNPNNYT